MTAAGASKGRKRKAAGAEAKPTLAESIANPKESPSSAATRMAKLHPLEADKLAIEEAKWLGVRVGVLRASIDEARKRQAKEAKERKARPQAAEPSAISAPPDDPRPVIRLAPGELHLQFYDAERLIGEAGIGIFQRGGLMVRVARVVEPTSGGVRRAPGTAIIVPADAATLRTLLIEHIRFEKFDSRSGTWRPTSPPNELIDALLAGIGRWPHVPVLLAVIEAATLRADGSLVDAPGYDAESGLFLASDVRVQVSERPARADAEAALAVLREPLASFPFVTPADESVMLAAIMTALVRRSLRSAPAFGVSAPTMASGKTLLATIVGLIATGRPPAMMSQLEDPEAERKRILAVLLESTAVAVLDNVERSFGSDTLCSVLTEPIFKDRLLGVSRTVSVPTCTTWLITGNNLTIVGDLTSRMLLARIDPDMERPEERQFRVNLHEEVPRWRADYIAAALTIIRAYLAAGSPRLDVPTYGRFEDWEKWCRLPLVWLGCADPCETRAALEQRDPVRERLAELTAAWLAVFGPAERTLAQVVAEATRHLPLVDQRTDDDKAVARLLAILNEIGSDGRRLNVKRLAWFVRKAAGRIEDGRRLVQAEERRSGATWRVEEVGRGRGYRGYSPAFPPNAGKCQENESDTFYRERQNSPDNLDNLRSADMPEADPAEVTLRGEAEL